MREYEATYIVDPNALEEDLEQLVEQYTEEIKKREGTVVNKHSWGKRRLTYPIKGRKEGFYTTISFHGNPEMAKEIDRLFRINDKVIRGGVFLLQDDEELVKSTAEAVKAAAKAEKAAKEKAEKDKIEKEKAEKAEKAEKVEIVEAEAPAEAQAEN